MAHVAVFVNDAGMRLTHRSADAGGARPPTDHRRHAADADAPYRALVIPLGAPAVARPLERRTVQRSSEPVLREVPGKVEEDDGRRLLVGGQRTPARPPGSRQRFLDARRPKWQDRRAGSPVSLGGRSGPGGHPCGRKAGLSAMLTVADGPRPPGRRFPAVLSSRNDGRVGREHAPSGMRGRHEPGRRSARWASRRSCWLRGGPPYLVCPAPALVGPGRNHAGPPLRSSGLSLWLPARLAPDRRWPCCSEATGQNRRARRADGCSVATPPAAAASRRTRALA